MRDLQVWLERVRRLVVARFPLRPQNLTLSDAAVGQMRQALVEAMLLGAAARQSLTQQVQVRIDEVDATIPTTDSDDPDQSNTWARRMVVTSARSPQAITVIILHRQSCVTVPSPNSGHRFPVVMVAGHVDPEDVRPLLTLPDAEDYLPALELAPDGRVVVNRTHYRAAALLTAGKTGHARPSQEVLRHVRDIAEPEIRAQADELDEILRHITRDPRVATLLHDWVCESSATRR